MEEFALDVVGGMSGVPARITTERVGLARVECYNIKFELNMILITYLKTDLRHVAGPCIISYQPQDTSSNCLIICSKKFI